MDIVMHVFRFSTIELSRIIFEYIIKNIKNDNVSSEPINKLALLMLMKFTNKTIFEDKSFKIDRTLDCSKFISETGFIQEEWKIMIERMKAFKWFARIYFIKGLINKYD